MKIGVVLFIFGFLFSESSGADMVNTVLAKQDNEKCEVNFFKRWTGYSHPVRVVEPMDFADALMRGNYQRAWTCERNSKTLFVLLERVEAQGMENIKINKDIELSFFIADMVDDGYTAGSEIAVAETFYLDNFYVEATETNGRVGKFLIRQKLGGKFEYMYDIDGRFSKLRVTNDDGVVTELDY